MFALIVLFFALSVSQVYSHGHLAHPSVFTGIADQRGNQNQVNNCGLVSNDAIRAAVRRYPPVYLPPGSRQQLIYTVTNGDGAGPLDISFDTTGAGTTFNTDATIITQVPGNNANLAASEAPGGTFPGDFPLGFTVPNNLNCPSGFCVMRVKNPQNFMSCMFVTTNPNFGSPYPSMYPVQQSAFLGSIFGRQF